MGSKICIKCNQRKDFTEFSFRNKTKGSRRADCKDCFKHHSHTHYVRHKSSYDIRSKTRRDASREFVLGVLLTSCCIDCKTTDIRILEFDHLSNKEYPIALMISRGYSLETLQKEISKCVIRCKNCHAIKTSKDNNDYRYQKWVELNGGIVPTG